jgi:hypothetical protein
LRALAAESDRSHCICALAHGALERSTALTRLGRSAAAEFFQPLLEDHGATQCFGETRVALFAFVEAELREPDDFDCSFGELLLPRRKLGQRDASIENTIEARALGGLDALGGRNFAVPIQRGRKMGKTCEIEVERILGAAAAASFS